MNIFVDGRQGTPITTEERVWIENEIRELEEYRKDEGRMDAEARSYQENGLTSFDRDVIAMCIDADIYGMKQTLEQGIVICW